MTVLPDATVLSDGAGLKLWPTELSNLYHWLDRPAETAARGGLAAH